MKTDIAVQYMLNIQPNLRQLYQACVCGAVRADFIFPFRKGRKGRWVPPVDKTQGHFSRCICSILSWSIHSFIHSYSKLFVCDREVTYFTSIPLGNFLLFCFSKAVRTYRQTISERHANTHSRCLYHTISYYLLIAGISKNETLQGNGETLNSIHPTKEEKKTVYNSIIKIPSEECVNHCYSRLKAEGFLSVLRRRDSVIMKAYN